MSTVVRLSLMLVASLAITAASIHAVSELALATGKHWVQANPGSRVDANYGGDLNLRFSRLRGATGDAPPGPVAQPGNR